jgi:type 1 glutamine amidotransferase
MNVAVVPESRNHPVLRGFEPGQWHVRSNLYLTAPMIDHCATLLLTGEIEGRVDPIAWTRMAGESRVFYTSLGHPNDMELPQTYTLMMNGVRWALGRD